MRGKKVDKDFLSEFITDCVKLNIDSPNEILNEAKKQIVEIDNKIKEIDKLKVLRSKLLDVVITFGEKENNTKELQQLNFFNIKNKELSKYICNLVEDKDISIQSLKTTHFPVEDTMYCVKQLIENNILLKNGDYIGKSSLYDDYIEFQKTII